MSRCETCIHFGTKSPYRKAEPGSKQPCCTPLPSWVNYSMAGSPYVSLDAGYQCPCWQAVGSALRDELAQVRADITRTALVVQALAPPRGIYDAQEGAQRTKLLALLAREAELIDALTPPAPEPTT
jgi:hypothetical protein